jgi:ribosomal 50S subunit-associated protein YjgA (DUF615 family)
MHVGVDGSSRKQSREQRKGAQSAQQIRHRSFHRPVIIARRRVDRDRVIANTKVALDSLLHEWPLPDCPYRDRATKACLAVIRGERPPAVARRAFVAAARAANILLEA